MRRPDRGRIWFGGTGFGKGTFADTSGNLLIPDLKTDMIFSAQQLVSRISHDMTLLPGDLICCGTSVGVGVMKDPVNTVTVAIDGIGELHAEFRQ